MAEITRRDRVKMALETAAREGRLKIPELSWPCINGWVPGWLLCHPSIGGSEGLRRLRELRKLGYVIKMTKMDTDTETATRYYRLVLDSDSDIQESLFDRPRPGT